VYVGVGAAAVVLAAVIIASLRGPAPVAKPVAFPVARSEPPRVAPAAAPAPAPKAERPVPAPPAKPAPKAAAAPPPAPKATTPASAKPAAPAPERTASASPAPAPKAEPAREEEPPTGFWRDQGITTKVTAKLQFNRKLWRTGIQVETREGVVTLRGNVPSQELIDEAVRITRDVYGVRAVRNELKIGQPDFTSSPGSGG
jgi:hypothetical protein